MGDLLLFPGSQDSANDLSEGNFDQVSESFAGETQVLDARMQLDYAETLKLEETQRLDYTETVILEETQRLDHTRTVKLEDCEVEKCKLEERGLRTYRKQKQEEVLNDPASVRSQVDALVMYKSPASVRVGSIRRSSGKEAEAMKHLEEHKQQQQLQKDVCDDEETQPCLGIQSNSVKNLEEQAVNDELSDQKKAWTLARCVNEEVDEEIPLTQPFVYGNEFQAQDEEEFETGMNTQLAVETIYFMRELGREGFEAPNAETGKRAEKPEAETCRRSMESNLETADSDATIDVNNNNVMRKDLTILDDMSRTSKRRRVTLHHRVIFSKGLPESAVKKQKKFLRKLGGEVVTDVADCTHFVSCGNFARSVHMLEAMAAGKLVVTASWLESSNVAGCFLNESKYILRDAKKERELGFSMSSTLSAAQQNPLLQGCKIHVTPHTRPSKNDLQSIIKAAGGKAAGPRAKGVRFVISCEEDLKLCRPFISKGIKIYSTELLLHGIVAYKLELTKFQLFQ